MNLNTGQLPTYKSLFPVLRTQTTCFSGIHLLCLMYVGFKLYDPTVNCGLDFAEAYEMALENQKAVLH